ncbi:MAG: hypothetical protein K2K41_05570, partial [Ruminiclostridium sp.]|nr:hypothetical protein [Ruminiclostridium sp.]
YKGWSKEIICENGCELGGNSARIEINTDGGEFEIRINGNPIHKATLKAVPHISAVCTVDEKSSELIIKLVNITENDITVNLASDIPLAENALLTVLTAANMQYGNSFDSPEAVVPVTNEVRLKEGRIDICARSVNVIRTALR